MQTDPDRPLELYNLADDLGETQDVAASIPKSSHGCGRSCGRLTSTMSGLRLLTNRVRGESCGARLVAEASSPV